MCVLFRAVLVVLGLWLCVGLGGALQCYQCGQYNDGVGSITPCINYTELHLKQCASRNSKFCIKYVSELSTVRDCVPDCTEKESWGTRTYCCNEDACNVSPQLGGSAAVVFVTSAFGVVLASRRF